MPQTKKTIYANLIKYRDPESSDYSWIWVNPSSGSAISPIFSTRIEAERWYDDIIRVHKETINLILRAKDGEFYKLKGRINIEEMLIYTKGKRCPFRVFLEEDTISMEILARSEEEAKERVLKHFDILEWL
jgi:hypothetical protein